jgi:nucleoside-diphosphate-sugar epimerase
MALPSSILVTGATGFLGSRTVERLLAHPEVKQIIAAGRSIKAHAHIQSPKVVYRLGDLADPAYVQSLFAHSVPQAIVNCAALSSPWGRYEEFYRANVLSQKHLIEQAETHGVPRFVYISTATLYFNYRDRWGVKESDPLPSRLVNHYASTKREAEILLAQSSLSHISIRPRALIGRGDTVIMPRLIRAYREGRLKIIGSGENQVDLTPVSNVVDAILLALEAPETACGRVYNITNGKTIALWPQITQILERLGMEAPTQKVPFWLVKFVAGLMELSAKTIGGGKEPTLTRYSVGLLAQNFHIDISLARQHLGYEPKQTVAQAMDEFVDWYQSLPDD